MCKLFFSNFNHNYDEIPTIDLYPFIESIKILNTLIVKGYKLTSFVIPFKKKKKKKNRDTLFFLTDPIQFYEILILKIIVRKIK